MSQSETTVTRTTFCKVLFCGVAAIGWCTATVRAQLNPPALSVESEGFHILAL